MEIQLAVATTKQQQFPEFKRWFGKSKCVDKQGKPLRVYHGTSKPSFNSFINGLNKAEGESGIFFTSDPETAGRYAGYDENFPSPVIGHVLPCYLKINKLHAHDFHGGKEGRADVIREALRKGCDGVLLLNHFDVGGTHPQWIVFHPAQIKSAIGNNGKFDEYSFDTGE